MTINEAKGQLLKYIGIHLTSPVFCHSQLYVALSRATSMKNVHILLPQENTSKTTNIAHPEVLLD
ncbi:helicase-like protein [Phlegmacium glaucopus]|nr:helicase-like protein [Phlegmacium glaucopus]